MPTLVVMPRLGMSMEQGTVTEWPRAVGERVEKGEVVVVVETEKSEAEVEATGSGILRHLYVGVGETVPCGTLLAVLTDEREETFDADALLAEHRRSAAPPRARRAAAAGFTGRAAERAASSRPPTERRVVATPRARRLARELGVEPAAIEGSGPGGRVTEDDVRAAARGQRIEVEEGVLLEVLEAGEGDTVLLLPGFGADASIYGPLSTTLVEGHRLLAIHLRGVGRSSAPESESYTVVRAAADVEAVAASSSSERVHVVGTSLGAAVALELALTHPGRVRSLALIAPFVTAGARLRAVVQSWRLLVRACEPETVASALLPWLFAEATLEQEKVRARLARGLAEMVAGVPAASLDRWAQGLEQWSGARASALGEIEAPTLVVVGEEDLLTPPEPEPWSSAANADVLVVPAAGHGVGLEAAGRVAEALASHFAQCREPCRGGTNRRRGREER